MVDQIEAHRAKVRKRLKKLAKYLDLRVPPGWGFALMMFERTGKPGDNMQWISNSERSGMVKTLREMADRLEHGFAGQKGVDDSDSILEV